MAEVFQVVGGGSRIIQFLTICTVVLFSSLNMSDVANRNTVVIVFFLFKIHLNFVSSRLQRDKNWDDVKCNPLEMVVETIVSGDSSKSFQKCIEYSYNQELNSQIDKVSKSNKNKMLNSKKEIEQMLEQPVSDSNIMQDLSGNIQKLSDKLDENQPAIKEVEERAKDINNWLSKIFTNIRQTSIVKNLKIQPDEPT
jgi:phosphoribosylaminoimidazole-succinocarboxamide synthase